MSLHGRMSFYAKSRSRKTHTKSRFGCATCKKRRVKCDEARPECTNCVRHSVECHYGLTSRSATPIGPSSLPEPGDLHPDNKDKQTHHAFISAFQANFTVPKRPRCEAQSGPIELSRPPDQETAVIQRPFQFTANDMALFHHCMSAQELKGYMPDELIRLGFSVHYVLHLLLAISGFHLNRKHGINPVERFTGQEFDCLAEAERHLNTAISQLAAVDPQLHADNGHTIYIASLFIFLCSLARGPRPGEYLAFRNDNDIPGLSLFLSMRSILEANNDLGTSKVISEMQPQSNGNANGHEEFASESSYNFSASHDPVIGIGSQFEGPKDHYSDQLNNLRILFGNTFPPTDCRHSAFIQVLELLSQRYYLIFDTANPISGSELWPQIFSWLYLLPNIVSSEMQKRHPVALVLFSYFAVLLQELDSVWFIQGWPCHIVRGILNSLDSFHSLFLSWPRKKLLLS